MRFAAVGLSLLVGCAGADSGSTDGQPDVHAHPVQVTLEVNPGEIEPGGRATLDWTARNALTVTLTQNGADLPLGTSSVSSGSLVVSPGGRTEYVLTGHGAAGRTAEASANLIVRVVAEGEGAAPQIKEFTASPESVGRDDEVLLSWNVTDADNLRLTVDGETVELDDATAGVGTARHTPGASATYRLTALNAHGEAAAEAHVTVPLAILQASVAPAAVAPGGEAVVSFRVQSADTVELTTDREGDAPIAAEVDADGNGTVAVAGVFGRTALTLTASDAQDAVQWTGEVGVNVPEIFAFEVAPDSAGIDDDVEISWRIEGADSLEVTATPIGGEPRALDLGGLSPAQGAVTDRPTDTTTYQLVATGREGASEAEQNVIVPVAVVELALVGSPAVLGGDVTAQYRVQGADDVTVRFADGEATPGPVDEDGRGSVEIEGLRASGTVTVTATRGDDSAERQAEVSLAAPAILAFESSVAEAGADAPARLSWDVLGAETLTLRAAPRVGPPQDIDIADEGVRRGGVTVAPFLATTYTLSATNEAGEVTEEVAVDVQPDILRFEAVPSPVPYGGDAVVRFRVHGVTTCEIDGGDVPFDADGNGALPLEGVVEPRTLTLTAVGPDDRVSQELQVRPARPQIERFVVSPLEVGIDEEVQISWQIQGATGVAIHAEPAVGEPYDLDLGDDPGPQGGVALTPGHSTVFTLTASNPEGDTEAEAAVTVPLQVLELELVGSPAVLGESVELRTRIQGALLVEVSVGDGPASELELAPDGRAALTIDDIQADTDIRLEAFDPEGAVTARSLLAELRIPEIASFTADPVQGGADIDVLLVWDARGTAALELFATPVGADPLEIGLPQGLPGEVTVRPSVTTEYELVARNAKGEARARLSVPVPLAFLEFSVEGAPVVPGGTVTVRYRVQGTTRVEASVDDRDRSEQPVGDDGRGEFAIGNVQSPFHVTVFASDGAGGEVRRDADITLAGPTVDSLSADPDPVHPGGTTFVSWSTSRADAVRVERLDGEGEIASVARYDDDSVALGSHETAAQVRPTTFRLVAEGVGDLEDSQEITVGVIRDPTGLRLSEVFYDAEGTDDDHEWIELRNEGEHAINLADVAIGYGGGSFTREVDALPERVVPPGGCIVVGGPVVDERSLVMGYDVELDFSPDIQNSGGDADGVALFIVVDGPVEDGAVPFDTVLYGGAVNPDHAFIGADGEAPAGPDVHDVDPGASIVRGGDGAWFEATIGPTPGRCFGLAAQDFSAGDSQVYLGRRRGSVFGSDIIGLRTFGLSAADEGTRLSFGATVATCFDDPMGVFCLTPPGVGEVDLTLTGPGGDVVYPAFFSYEQIPLCSIVDFDLDDVVTGEDYVGTVRVSRPNALAVDDMVVESGWGPLATDPSLTPDLWTWTPIGFVRTEEDGKETFEGPAEAPDEAGSYLRTFRAGPNSDVFTYCADSPLVYSPELLDTFTVSEPVPQ